MMVQAHIDERNSPFKATEGAARLLKENHMILKRLWPSAVTVWNHGPSGVRRAMKGAGSLMLEDLSRVILKNLMSKKSVGVRKDKISEADIVSL